MTHGDEEEEARSIEDTFLAACEAFEKVDVRYVVVGAFAASAWGTPRSTQDVDVLVEVPSDGIPQLVRALDDQDLTLRVEDLEAAVREGSHATAFDERSLYHVDIRPVTDTDTRRTLDNAEEITYHGRTVPLASPDETIAHKLLYGSDQDLADAEAILVRQDARLDMGRLRSRCRDLGVLEELETLREAVSRQLDDEA